MGCCFLQFQINTNKKNTGLLFSSNQLISYDVGQHKLKHSNITHNNITQTQFCFPQNETTCGGCGWWVSTGGWGVTIVLHVVCLQTPSDKTTGTKLRTQRD